MLVELRCAVTKEFCLKGGEYLKLKQSIYLNYKDTDIIKI